MGNINFVRCVIPIDDTVFHDGSFTECALTYSGTGTLIFDKNNIVEDSTLQLAPAVQLDREDVQRLVCGFPWKEVSQGTQILTCNANGITAH